VDLVRYTADLQDCEKFRRDLYTNAHGAFHDALVWLVESEPQQLLLISPNQCLLMMLSAGTFQESEWTAEVSSYMPTLGVFPFTSPAAMA
jgi:hypothetical protein